MNFIVHTSHGDYRVTAEDAKLQENGTIYFFNTNDRKEEVIDVLFNSWRHIRTEGADFMKIEEVEEPQPAGEQIINTVSVGHDPEEQDVWKAKGYRISKTFQKNVIMERVEVSTPEPFKAITDILGVMGFEEVPIDTTDNVASDDDVPTEVVMGPVINLEVDSIAIVSKDDPTATGEFKIIKPDTPSEEVPDKEE